MEQLASGHEQTPHRDTPVGTMLERGGELPRIVLGIFTAMSPVSLTAALVVGTVHAIGGVAAESMWSPLAMVLFIYSLLWTALLLLFYASHLLGSKRIGATSKVLWALAFLLAPPVSLPFYFVAHVWRDRGQPDEGPSLDHPYAEPHHVHVTEIPLH